MKCFQKIAEFRAEGGAIILVSHNPYTIRTNCDRVAWLEHGKVREIGEVTDICDAYEVEMGRESTPSLQQRYGDGTIHVSEIECPAEIATGAGLSIRVVLESDRKLDRPIIQVSFTAAAGQHVAINDTVTDQVDIAIERGPNVFELYYPALPLRPGVYTFNVAVSEQLMTNLRLMDLGVGRIEVRGDRDEHGAGVLALAPIWHVEAASRNEAAR